MSTTRILYDLAPGPGSCPFAQRAWLALKELELPFEHKLIDKKNKSKEFLDLFASITSDPRDNATVPVLIDGEDKIAESAVVVEYLAKKYTQQVQLLPSDPLTDAKVRLFVELFTKKFQGPFFKWIGTPKDSSDYSGLADAFTANLKALDSFLKDSGSSSGAFFLGERYSYAETMTTPWLRRGTVGLKAFRDYDIEKVVEDEGLTRLQSWIKASLDRPSNKTTGGTDEQIIELFKQYVK